MGKENVIWNIEWSANDFFWFFFCHSRQHVPWKERTEAHCGGKTALFSNPEDGFEPERIPFAQLSHGAMQTTNPGPGDGAGRGCASRAGVQVASPLSRAAKGQETCGVKGAEEKVARPDSVFLMTCTSKRKAGGDRKWLSLTAPGQHGKPPCLSLLAWLAGAMLGGSNR